MSAWCTHRRTLLIFVLGTALWLFGVDAFSCYPEYAFDWCENSTEASCVHNYAFSVGHFQRKLTDYYTLNRRPPLAEAFFLTRLPKPFQEQFLDNGCHAPLILAYLLVATAKLEVDDDAAKYANIAMGLVGNMPEMLQKILYESRAWPFQEAIAHFDESANKATIALNAVQARGTAHLIEIVVSHCREPLDWLADDLLPIAPADARLTIYEKCGEQSAIPASVLAHFGNVSMIATPDPEGLPRGDECLAYLSHIVNRYGDLAPFTIFLQADPDQHLHFTYLQTVLATLARGAYNTPYQNLNGARHVRTHSPCMNAVHEAIFEEPLKEPVGPYCCAQFIVQGDRVRERPLSFYMRMLRMVDGSMGSGDLCSARPVTRSTHCYGMEFLWHRVFGEDYETPLRQDDTRLPLPLRQKFGNEFKKSNWNDMVLNPNTPKKIVEKINFDTTIR